MQKSDVFTLELLTVQAMPHTTGFLFIWKECSIQDMHVMSAMSQNYVNNVTEKNDCKFGCAMHKVYAYGLRMGYQ